ncbi:MAG: NTP transferase domain-containing protein [Anaerolineales bacterium]
MQVDAIVTAGGVPKPDEPLYPYTQGKSKALLEVTGRPMIQWVLDALSGAQAIRRVVVVGLNASEAPLGCEKTLGFVPNHGSLIDNIAAGVGWILGQDASAKYALLVSSDIPTITSKMVNWNVATSLQTDHEAYYSIIPKAEMERRFPGSKRSYFKFKDGTFTGSDMNLMQTALASHYHPAWHRIVAARKNALAQASLIGLDSLLLFALGQLTLADAERRVSRRLNIHGRLMICPYPEAGMDVDKPAQYELVQRDLELRGAQKLPP